MIVYGISRNAHAPLCRRTFGRCNDMAENGLIEHARLRALVGAGIALSSELSLDDLLRRLVESAATLTGARYVTLAMIDSGGHGHERHIAYGTDDDVRHDEDERLPGPSTGTPGSSFIAVPLILRGVTYGNLSLREKAGGRDFDIEDEDVVGLLAAQAAVAIENARLFEESRRWTDQLEALNEVGNALATEIELPRLLDLTARRLRELIDARLIAIALPRTDGRLTIEAADGERAEEILGLQLERAGSKSGRVLERRRSERIDSLLDDPEVDCCLGRPMGAHTGLYVPLIVRDQAIGVIVVHDKTGRDPRFTQDDQRLAETFASRAAAAVDQSRRVAGKALRQLVETQELERRRLARELHDQTGQELISVLLGLKAIEDAVGPDSRARALKAVREQVVETLHGVRRLAVELRPKALDDYGLAPALERLTHTFAGQAGLKLEMASQLGTERLPSEIETALYRIVQEALTNIAKHAHARNASIVLRRGQGAVMAVIEDDGRGFDLTAAGSGTGLNGMRERLALIGGTLKIETRFGSGATLVAVVPLP